MTFGVDQTPTGRPKGAPNKDISLGRQAIARFVDDNAHRLLEWLDAIAEKDAKQAFDAYMSVVEFHIPKLSRAENINKTVGILQIVLEAGKAQQALEQSGVTIDADTTKALTQQVNDALGLVEAQQTVEVVAGSSVTNDEA